MEKTASHILKSNNVKLEGQFHLDIGQGTPTSANKKNTTSAPAKASIVENHPEFTVIELTCRCGMKTYIKCEYTDTQAAEQLPNQNINGESNSAN